MKKVVCISSMLVIIQSCVGMQDNLTEKYNNIAQLDEKYSEHFLEYCELRFDCIKHTEEWLDIAEDGNGVISDIDTILSKRSSDVNELLLKEINTYLEDAYKRYNQCINNGLDPLEVNTHNDECFAPEIGFALAYFWYNLSDPLS